MDSDSDVSDSDFFSERAIRKKLAKLVRLSQRNATPSHELNLPDVAIVQQTFFNSSGHDSDYEETIKVVFPLDPASADHRMAVRRNDCFVTVFKQLADLKNVPFDHVELVMMPLNRDVSQFDCLDTLNYEADYCFHAFLRRSARLLTDSRGTGDIEITCVCLNNVVVYKMYEDQPLDVLMAYCARDFGCDKSNVQLVYDEELVRPFQTCNALDIMSYGMMQVRLIS